MNKEDDPNAEMRSMIRKKFTRSVSKVKNYLRWSFSKKNFLKDGSARSRSENNSLFSQDMFSVDGHDSNTEEKKTTKVKLFSKKPEKDKLLASGRKINNGKPDNKSGRSKNKQSMVNSLTVNGETKPETDKYQSDINNISKVENLNQGINPSDNASYSDISA
jgi:hypothetical protein